MQKRFYCLRADWGDSRWSRDEGALCLAGLEAYTTNGVGERESGAHETVKEKGTLHDISRSQINRQEALNKIKTAAFSRNTSEMRFVA